MNLLFNLKYYIKKAALLLAGSFFMWACSNTEQEISAALDKHLIREDATDIETYLSQGGILKAKLTAPLMHLYQTDSPYMVFPQTLHVDFYAVDPSGATVDHYFANSEIGLVNSRIEKKDTHQIIKSASSDTITALNSNAEFSLNATDSNEFTRDAKQAGPQYHLIRQDSLIKESKLDALYAKYYQSEHKIFLKDSVVVINMVKGDTLYCDELWWDQKTERFYTDKKVRIRTKTQVIDGIGMDAKQNFSEWNILKGSGRMLFRETDL